MSELQADTYTIEEDPAESVEDENVETEQSEETAESAPDSGETHNKKVGFTEEQQRIFDEAISKKVFKAKEAEREAARLRKELDAIKAAQPKETPPDIPPMPEPYAENYEAEVAARDKAIRARAEYELRESQRAEDQLRADAASGDKAAEQFQAKVSEYMGRAKALGVTEQELQAAGQSVANYGIHDELVGFILDSEAGPLITRYLSKNLAELDKLSEMSPIKAAVYIENVLKHKAVGSRKTTSAPDPVDTLRGTGAPRKERGPVGATYD